MAPLRAVERWHEVEVARGSRAGVGGQREKKNLRARFIYLFISYLFSFSERGHTSRHQG